MPQATFDRTVGSLSARPAALESKTTSRLVHIIRDHYATMDSQLTVACDDQVELLNDRDRYWWLVRDATSGRTGYVPADIVETAAEREARKNRERNVEITQVRPTDITAASMPWRRARADSQEEHPGEELFGVTGGGSKLATWQMSGFARRPVSGGAHLRSAPAIEGNTSHTSSTGATDGYGGGRHKKTVSFSKRQPEEHTIRQEEDADIPDANTMIISGGGDSEAVDELSVQMASHAMGDPEEGPLGSPVFPRDLPPLDPIVEKLLEREFGKPLREEIVPTEEGQRTANGIVEQRHEEDGCSLIDGSKYGMRMGGGDGSVEEPSHQLQHCRDQSHHLSSNNGRAPPTDEIISNASPLSGLPVITPFPTKDDELKSGQPIGGDKGDLEHYTFLEDHARATLKPASTNKGSRLARLLSSTKIFGRRKTGAGGMTAKDKSGTASSLASMPDQQLLRVYAGNFTSLHGYKTLLVEEACSMAEVAERACEKFTLINDGHDYVLNVVHFDTHEILPVAATTILASVIEMAKRATIMEGGFAPETGRSWARLPRTARRRHERRAKQHWQALVASTPGPLGYGSGAGAGKSYPTTPMTPGVKSTNFSCLASPVIQLAHASEADLPRDRGSDFVTHYKFVLNRFLDGPAGTTPFYIKVQIMMPGSMSRAGLGAYSVEEDPVPGNARSPMPTRTSSGLSVGAGTARIDGSVAKMLINTSMSVGELLRAALLALDVAPNVPGLKYEIYLACKPDNLRDRIFLTRDMVVHDILHLKPMVDPSGLTLVLQPVLDSKVQMIVQ